MYIRLTNAVKFKILYELMHIHVIVESIKFMFVYSSSLSEIFFRVRPHNVPGTEFV